MEKNALFASRGTELKGERLSITPMRPSDSELFGRLVMGPLYDTYKRVVGHEPDSGIDKILSHEAEDITHAIRINGYDDFAGWITLQHNEDGQPDIGISLLPEHRGHGYGPEAVKLYCNWLNQKYGLSRIYVRISDDNEYSMKAFSKLGAIRYDTRENVCFKMLMDKLPEKFNEINDSHPVGYYFLNLPIDIN